MFLIALKNEKATYEVYLKTLATAFNYQDCGIRRLSSKTVAENQILMDLRVAVKETSCDFREKGYMTQCVSVGNESEGKTGCGSQTSHLFK